ncbi:MAG: hypothetical protein G01um101456_221 [Parcubacteria group bacterium Gr01-1014_56]|nr:MAG: hypothetical protein G01um101456_221 [Parcubacteria group bacterium Gr01-1014_56]
MKTLLGIAVVIAIALAGFIAFSFLSPQTAVAPDTTDNNGVPTSNENLSVTSPAPKAAIASPVTITGSALGTYYFEASFPIDILDENKNIVGQGHAEAQSDWMTESLVPFVAIVTFTSTGAGKSGFIRLKNDNPSGDPIRDKYFDLPIAF